MRSIQHLSKTEQQHFILCHCGHYVDMRDLAEVFFHQHAGLPQPDWDHVIKKGDFFAILKDKKKIGLN